MAQKRDTRDNPFSGRDYNSPSNMTRIGNSLRFTAIANDPDDNADGVPTQDWKSIHVIFYGDPVTSVNMVARFRPWRWYAKQVDGHAGVSGVEVGWWIPDFQVTVAVDPATVTAAITSHLAWPTRDAEKMYFQFIGVFDATTGLAAVMPLYVSAQIFGDAHQDDPVCTSVSSIAGGGGAIPAPIPAQMPFMAATPATHWSPADGAVVFNNAVSLNALAGWPFVVDDTNCAILGLIVRKATNAVVEYVNGHNGITLTATAGVVTIAGAGAAPFANTDLDWYLYVVYQEKAYTEATDSLRTEEIAPLNHEHTQPAYAINNQAVVAASVPPGINVPSDNGIVMDGYKDIAWELYLLGGQTNGHANCTVTVKFQGSNDVEVPVGTRQWVDLAVGYDLGTDLTAASWLSVGLTALVAQIDFDNWEHKRIRANYSFDVAPGADHPGVVSINYRLKAL